MDLYARVNILDGKAVRLPKGNVKDAVALDADPVARATGWVDKGADYLHIVDLNAAAYNDHRNRQLLEEIVSASTVPVQLAGGIRSLPEAARLLEAGAWRVVMGTTAIEDQVLFWDICREHPGRIVVSLDVLPNEELTIRGWTHNSGVFLEETLIEVSSAGAVSFIVTEANRDALNEPPNLLLLRRALSYVSEPVIAGGGVRNLEDLQVLLDLEEGGRKVGGVIVGREVTEGRFTMDQAAALLGSGSAN